jgi:hypothetical protein
MGEADGSGRRGAVAVSVAQGSLVWWCWFNLVVLCWQLRSRWRGAEVHRENPAPALLVSTMA